jgi:hypothetical protein
MVNKLIKNSEIYIYIKYIDIQYPYTHEQDAYGTFELIEIELNNNLVDLVTKLLAKI